MTFSIMTSQYCFPFRTQYTAAQVKRKMNLEKRERVEGRFWVNVADDIQTNRKDEKVLPEFKSGKDFLEWLRYNIQDFEPFPNGKVIQDFRQWEKGSRQAPLAKIQEESEDTFDELWNDKANTKRVIIKQIDTDLRPHLKVMIQSTQSVWESFDDESLHTQQSKVPPENWFPVDWGEEKKDEEEVDERELFEERKPDKTKKGKSRFLNFLRRKNKKQGTSVFSRLFKFFN